MKFTMSNLNFVISFKEVLLPEAIFFGLNRKHFQRVKALLIDHLNTCRNYLWTVAFGPGKPKAASRSIWMICQKNFQSQEVLHVKAKKCDFWQKLL